MLVAALRHLETEIGKLDVEIRWRARGSEVAWRLMTTQGIGTLIATAKLMIAAHGKWRKLDGRSRLPEIIEESEFRDGLRQLQTVA